MSATEAPAHSSNPNAEDPLAKALIREIVTSGGAGSDIRDFITVGESSIGGRGVFVSGRAKKPVKAGLSLATIPLGYCYTAEAAKKDKVLGPLLKKDIRDDDAIALLLLRERSQAKLGSKGKGRRPAHIPLIPTEYDSTVFWTEEELKELDGSDVAPFTRRIKGQIQQDYAELQASLFSKNPEVFPPEDHTLELYVWAHATIWSRAVDFYLASQGRAVRVIAPFLDMFNSDPVSPSVRLVIDPSHGAVGAVTLREVKPGEELTISYGSMPNSRLIRLYGFTLDGPLFHEVVLQIQTDPEALSESQRDLLRKADALGPFPMLPLDPIPTPLLICLRVLHMTPEEAAAILSDEEALGAVLKGHKLDNRREASVINSLQMGIAGRLDDYKTSLDADMDKLHAIEVGILPPKPEESKAEGAVQKELKESDAAAAAAPPERQRMSVTRREHMALLLRIGEKLILYTALQASRKMLMALVELPEGDEGEEGEGAAEAAARLEKAAI